MKKRHIKSIAHWTIMTLLLLFPVLMVGLSVFQNNENSIETKYEQTNLHDLSIGNEYLLSASKITDTTATRFQIFPVDNTIVYNGDTYNDVDYLLYYVDGGTVPYVLLNRLNNIGFGNYVRLDISSVRAVFTLQQLFIETDSNSVIKDCFYHIYTVDTNSYKSDVNSWVNGFLDLTVNQWYRDLMNVIGVGFTTSTVMNVIYVMPLYVLWVYVLDLIVDCLLLIINFGHDALHRLGADNE